MNLSLNSSTSSNNLPALDEVYQQVELNRENRPDPEFTLNMVIQNTRFTIDFNSVVSADVLAWLSGEPRPRISRQSASGQITINIHEDDFDLWRPSILARAELNDNVCDILFVVQGGFETNFRAGDILQSEFWDLLCGENPDDADALSFKSLETLGEDLGNTFAVFSKRWFMSREEVVREAQNLPVERIVRVTDLFTGRVKDRLMVRTWHEAVNFASKITRKKWIRNDNHADLNDWEGGLREERLGYVSRSLLSFLNLMMITKYWCKAFLGFGEPANRLYEALSTHDDHFHDTFSELIGSEFWDIHGERMSDYVEWHDDVVSIADTLLNYYLMFIA